MAETKNEVISQNTQSKAFQSALAKTQKAYTEMVVSAAAELNLQYNDYQKVCVFNLITKMKELLDKEKMDITAINQTNVTTILQTAAMLNLNAAASPRECYVILRNVNVGTTDKPSWKKEFEFGVEGDGNDKILRTYGVGVEKVYNCWQVREEDEFLYPSFNGLDIVPPKWQPKSYTGKVVRIVYPILMKDGNVEYHIAEREEVRVNLLAHISNNLMKVKDGSPYYRKKEEINERLSTKTLDEIFKDPDALKIMSPAWRSPHSREAMIVRKMRNNATKKIPKDFSNAFVTKAYEESFDDYEQYQGDPRINAEEALDVEFTENAASEPITIESKEKSEPILNEEVKEPGLVKAKAPF